MEKLSIKSGKKAFLAVALVIFMLVAFLGLTVLATSSTFAAAEGEALTWSAAFTGTSATAHDDSTVTVKYYNTVSLPLAVNNTFTVTYTPAISSGTFTGAILDLYNAGFQVTGITVGETALTGDAMQTVSGLNFTPTNGFQYDTTANLVIDGSAASVPAITVVYKLTSAIAVFTNKTISLTSYAVVAGNYEEITTAPLTIYVRSETAMTVTTSGDKTYDATPATASYSYTQTVSATGDAVLPTPSFGWESGNQTDVGTYTYSASAASNNFFEAASDSASITISKKAVTISAENKTSEHTEDLVALTYTASPFYSRDAVVITPSTTATPSSNVGEYPITLALDDSGKAAGVSGLDNYTVTNNSAIYTITRKWIAVPTVEIYNDGAALDPARYIAVGETENVPYNGEVYSFSYAAASDNAYSGNDPTRTNFGTVTLTLTIGSNYRWGASKAAAEDLTDKTFTINIQKVNLHVSLNHAAITYRDAVPTSGFSISLPTAAVGGETVEGITLTQSDFETDYVQGSPVASYDITIDEDCATDTAIKTAFSNYNVIYDTADKLSVGKLTVTADNTWVAYAAGNGTYVYDAAAHGIVAVATGYTFGGVQICDVAYTGGDSNGAQTHVSGTGETPNAVTLTATFSLKGDSAKDDYNNVITENYTLAEGVQTKDITITRKAVTITADDKSTIYGSAAPAFTSDAGSVLISGDTYSTTGSMTTAYTATAGNANRVVNTYAIVPAGWANNDYAISYVNGTLTVNQKVVTFTWSATKSWVYDAASHTITATVVGAEYGETITVATYSGDANATNVGNYSRTVTSLSDNANYAITDAGTQTESYSITKAPITITITPATSLVYNSAEQTVFTVTVSGMIGEETLTYTFDGTNIKEADGTFALGNGNQNFTGFLATTAYDLELTEVANGSGLVGNYEYSLPAAAENTIAKATLTWADATYNVATANWTAPTGIQTNDVDEDAITFAYSLKLGGVEKLASASALTYTATEAGVYTLSVSWTGTRAAEYNALAPQTLNTVYTVTFTDTASEHTSEPTVFADVVKYAFSGQSVAAIDPWHLNGYDWNGWKYTPESSEITYDAPAVSGNITVRATWIIKQFTVIYKYRLAGTEGWTTYLEEAGQLVTFDTALATVPSKTWFSNIGWKSNSSLTGEAFTVMTLTADTTFYTEYYFSVAIGDVNGDAEINAADATLYRQYLAGGYTVRDASNNNGVATIAAAWELTEDGDTTGKFLKMTADVNGDGKIFANDITTINAGIAEADTNFAVAAATSDAGETFTGIVGTVDSVIVAGDKAAYTISNGTLTLDTALTSGQTVTIVTKRAATAFAPGGIAATDEVAVKYTYTKA